jgi:predicted DNA-binding transcriptional regulator AlpA
VRPERIIAIPRYYLRWIPYLGVDLAWIPIGFRQVAFLKGCAFEEGDEFEASSAEIALWSGLSRRSFWRKINDPMLGWFVKPVVPKSGVTWVREEDGTLKQLPGRWRVVMSMPLCPADQRQLRSWLRDRLRDGLTPAHALQAALQTPIDLLLPSPQTIEIPEVAGEPQGVEQVVRSAIRDGAGSPALKPLVQALAHYIAGYSDPFLVTHYFMRKCLPRLGAGPGWLVQYLRVLAAETGQGGSVVTVGGGMPELARRMGTSRKSIQRWLNDGGARPFLTVEGYLRGGDKSIGLLVKVMQDEPLFDDRGEPSSPPSPSGGQSDTPVALTPGQSGIPAAPSPGHPGTSDAPHHGQNDTPAVPRRGQPGTSVAAEVGQSDTPAGPAHGHTGTVKGGGGLIIDSEFQEEESTTTYADASLSRNGQRDIPARDGEEKWDLAELLRLARVHPARARQLAAASPEAWVSWLLYWASSQGAKLNEPIGNAVNRLSADPRAGAGGAFDRLAALGPKELRSWVVPRVLSPYAALPDSRDGSWEVIRGAPSERLRQLADYLGFDLSWEWEEEEAREEELDVAPGAEGE